MATTGPTQTEQPARVVATGHGLIVALVSDATVSAGRLFVFSVQQAGAPENEKRFTIAKDTVSIETVRVHTPTTLAIVGATAMGAHTLAIVDSASGRSVYSNTCVSLRLTPDQSRYLCGDTSGKLWSYRLGTREVHQAMLPVEGALRLLRTGTVAERWALLRDLVTSSTT